MYLPNPSAMDSVTQGQFLKWGTAGLNSEFTFS